MRILAFGRTRSRYGGEIIATLLFYSLFISRSDRYLIYLVNGTFVDRYNGAYVSSLLQCIVLLWVAVGI